MLVFSMMALAQTISALGSDTVCAVSTVSEIPACLSASVPVVSTTPAVKLAKAASLFDFFPSASSDKSTEDESTWGDSIHQDPGDLHRIYFQNIDGLRNDADEIALYVSSMAHLNVGSFCWADPGLDFSQAPVRQRLQRPICNNFCSARSAFSSSTLPETTLSGSSGYQPGGTFMATTGRWSTRSTGKPLVDPSGLGRWSGLCFSGKRGKRLALLTAYRSPRQQPTGGFGFYDQQHSLLLSKGIAKPNVRKQFVTDLVLFVNNLQSDGYEVMVSLDANETVGQDKTFGLSHLISACTLVDLHCLGPSEPPATYKYGRNRRIDYMFGSAGVASAICRAGYNAYDHGVFSKHRGLFVDLDFTQLMGSVDPIAPTKARVLRSEDQPSVDRYLEAFKQYADDHRLWGRVEDLTTVAPTLTPTQCKEAFDAIDRDVTRGMLHSEKEARRPAGKYAWSPKLREAGLIARYWHLQMREVESGICLRDQIERLLVRIKSLNIELLDDTILDSATLKVKWKEAIKILRTVRNTAFDHRAVHLMGTLESYHSREFSKAEIKAGAQKENNIKIRRISRLINIESMRKPFQSIHASLTPTHAGGLSKLFVPSGIKNHKVASKFCDAQGHVSAAQLIAMAQSDKASVEYSTLLDCDAIDEELTRYNREWFRQAKDTPFGHGELFDLVGYDGLTETATAIVDGDCIEYLGIPMQRELQVFLEECRRPDSVEAISTAISPEQFVSTVKASWKESTSTSPSGRHLGHYRTAILDPAVTSLHTQLLNLPIAHGFAPERWTHSVTPLIEKDTGLPYLTRLRVIHLFEADYNLFLKIIFGRRMVKNAEKAQALNEQQHGSRPRRMTTDALFFARLEKDLIRQVKANSAHMDNDATGCYDRIVTSLGMIACRRLGMPEQAIKCQAEALRLMRYSVKHVYGTSPQEYSSSDTEPLFGTGQGSGASPAIWLGLVVILLNALDRMSEEDNIPGLAFVDPWNDFRATWRVGAFVDDTNQGILDDTGVLSIDEFVEQIRRAGQLWESLLHISGGSLNLAKCSWTLQYWEWSKGRPHLLPMLPTDPQLLMTSGASPEHHSICQHSNFTEIKGLGAHMNFMGTFALHAATMRIKFDGMARRLRQSSLSPALSMMFYKTFYLPSVRYSLPVTSMTNKELHRVQSLMTACILNKLGYNRHYPHAVAFAPTSMFGCGLIDLRVEQGMMQIQALLDYVGTQQRVGLVMLISLRHLQTEAGVSFDLLATPQVELPYLTDCWILSLRRFCADSNISLRVRRNRIPSVSREGDSMLMDKAITLGLTKQELIDLNLVRIFLGVTTVSDIATADGSKLHPFVWKGHPIPDRVSCTVFARQETPTSYQRGLWRRLLRSFLHPSAAPGSLLLLTPLGSWTSASTMRWGAMMWDSKLYRSDPSLPRGRVSEERHISVHFPRRLVSNHSPPLTYYDDKPDWYTATIPSQATATDLTGRSVFTATTARNKFASIPKPAISFQEWVEQLPTAERRLIESHYFAECDAEHALVQYLQLPCTLVIGTDGGKCHRSGSFSWILCSPGNEQLVLNAGPVDGWHRCQSSLRSEAAAIASLTLYVDELAMYHQVEICCTFQLYVDSTSAITNVKLLRDLIPKRRFPNNADLLSTMGAAHHVIEHFLLTHVHSHQDKEVSFADLPFPAQLNVLCDTMATKQMERQETNAEESTIPNPLCPRNLNVEVRYAGQVISSHYTARLRECIGANNLRIFYQTKYKWSDQVWDSVAWDALTTCGQKPVLTQPVNRSKIVNNWLNLGAQRAKFGRGATTLEIERCCPYCQQAEDFTHMLTCADPRAMKFRYNATVPLRTALSKSGNAGDAILQAIKVWTLTPEVSISINPANALFGIQPAIDRAMASQTKIGWAHLFRGFVSIDWGHIYHASDLIFLTPEDRRIRADKTLTEVIMAVHDYSLLIWKSRNAVLHEVGSDSLNIVHAALNHSISQLYSLKSTFSPIIQSYFTMPLEDLLRRSPRQRKRWLRLARLATSHSSATGTKQQLLSTYFPYAFTMPDDTVVLPSTESSLSTTPKISRQLPITTYFAAPGG
jgi:hypothetical protein